MATLRISVVTLTNPATSWQANTSSSAESEKSRFNVMTEERILLLDDVTNWKIEDNVNVETLT